MHNYLVLDTETTIRNRGEEAIGNNQGSYLHPDNFLVAIGSLYKPEGDSVSLVYTKDSGEQLPTLIPPKDTVFVAHNAGFDIKWLWHVYPEWREWFSEGTVWCTQLAEYLLTGQTHKFPTLDDTCTKYGGVLKNTAIKDFWESGVDTTDIPKDMLLEYLEHDVLNTELTYLGQLEKAERLGMLPLMRMHMESLLATVEMEYNGCKFSREQASADILASDGIAAKHSEVVEALHTMMKETFKDDLLEYNTGSQDQLSAFLYGGFYKIPGVSQPSLDKEGNLQYYKGGKKKGQIKLKNVTLVRYTEGVGAPINKEKYALKKPGFYQTNDKVLHKILNKLVNLRQTDSPAYKAIELLLKYRELDKEYGTYYKGYPPLVWPHDSCIHHSLNTCATATGRLSSSNPNMQNLPR